MKKLSVIVALALVAACGTDDKKAKPAASLVNTACTASGASNCEGANLLTCQGGKWQVLQNCATSGRVCGDSGANKACVNAPGSSTYNGFEPGSGASFALFDPAFVTLFMPVQMLSAYDDAADPTIAVTVENWAQFQDSGVAPGQTATVALTGDELDYNRCGICITAQRSDGSAVKSFFQSGGSVSVTAPGATGGEMSATITGVTLVEVDDNYEPISGGETWSLDGVTLSAASGPWPCELFSSNGGPTEGQAMCRTATGGSTTIYEVWSCTSGALAADSCATGQTCSTTANPAAVCQ